MSNLQNQYDNLTLCAEALNKETEIPVLETSQVALGFLLALQVQATRKLHKVQRKANILAKAQVYATLGQDARAVEILEAL